MFYSVALTIPANTPASAPVTQDVLLVPGTIHQVAVEFPPGCVGLVHTLARRGAHQVWPSNEGANLAANAETIAWADEYDLDDAPFTLRLYGWSLDDFYSHTVTWRFAQRLLPTKRAREAAAALYQLVIDTPEAG